MLREREKRSLYIRKKTTKTQANVHSVNMYFFGCRYNIKKYNLGNVKNYKQMMKDARIERGNTADRSDKNTRQKSADRI
jgi:hypothetical protein